MQPRQGIQIVKLPQNSLQGGIPEFTSTLLALAMHENHLETVPNLRIMPGKAGILLHRNRLSCRPPRWEDQAARVAIVALGNHLGHPGGAIESSIWARLMGMEPRRKRERESPKHRFLQKTADFRRFTPSPGNEAFGGRRKPQKTADFCRKPQETGDWAPSP